MDNYFKVKFWGIRGELPNSPHLKDGLSQYKSLFTDFFKSGFSSASEIDTYIATAKKSHWGGYGVSTTCVEITTPSTQIIIDGGSGIKSLGDSMLKGPAGKGQGDIHIFISDFEWENLIGLPFFTPIFIPKNQIHFYSISDQTETNIKSIFTKPYFPVDFKHLMSTISFIKLEKNKPLKIQDLEVTPIISEKKMESQCNYKIFDPTLNKTYFHNSSPHIVNLKSLSHLKNCDLMYSSLNSDHLDEVFKIAQEQSVQKLILGKYKMDQSTKDIESIENELNKRAENLNLKVPFEFAQQDLELYL